MKIAILLSGGVDSSVALNLIKNDHEVTAFYLKVWLEEELSFLGSCPWKKDLEFIHTVCEKANVPLEIVPLQSEYLETVVSYVLNELKAGRTPNPDIFCNQWIKFGKFFKKINSTYDRVASGHYASIEEANGNFLLKKSPDPIKDQTYFLSTLNQAQLGRILFPIGHLKKIEVRELAQKYDLPNKHRKDSQGICFLGKIKYPDFIRYHLGDRPGNIIELESGSILGKHKGFWYYTIGQRQGLGLGGGPWYVVKKDTNQNSIYVSHSNYQDLRAQNIFTVVNLNWISHSPEKQTIQVKIRHGPKINDCQIKEIESNRLSVKLSSKDRGIASGQVAVFYDGEICLGGGIIE